jgi:para-aminobenzoate synthetase component I
MTTETVVKTKETILCKLHYKKISATINPAALSEVFSRQQHPAILGGNDSKSNSDRFSFWMAEPKEIFEFRAGQKDPFSKLQKAIDKYKLKDGFENKLPKGIFCGGWAGYFGYELGRYIEKLPATTTDDLRMPLIHLCFYDRVIAYDHIEKTSWVFILQLSEDTETPQEKFGQMERLLAESQKIVLSKPVPADIEKIDFSEIQCNMDKDYYLETIKQIRRYIYDGEVYQINFSQRFECDYTAQPLELYHWQNHYNPSPYAAYIDDGKFHIVSASPEMFITITDGIIRTKPIKGTRPLLNDSQTNEKNFNELLDSEKEQAELNMIIDLERNDLGRICKYGTIKVVQPRTIETYPTVFHAVATVEGQIREEITFCDILKAMFPGGSITGAPKIRAMEIIDQTEPTARGVYTGSIGFIGIDGSVCLNIAIRTIIIAGKKAFIQTGGGIVADSNAQAEWQETITKARALLAGINSVERTADSI